MESEHTSTAGWELAPLMARECRIFAGPCSAESEEQVLEAARGVRAAGADVFRAGLWKPRTKPGGFEGVGAAGLPWLRRVKKETGLPVATEIATGAHLRLALRWGVDCVWLGARTTANPFAVQEIADTFASLSAAERASVAVLVKNPVNPDLELWVGALERLHAAGVRRLGAVHRGFSSYGETYYRNAPMWRIPIELKRRLPQLPLLFDPSHTGGRRELIAPLSRQAMLLEFDGLMIESHCHPECALSDAAQQITPAELASLLESLQKPEGNAESVAIDDYRRNIDAIDEELLALLARRLDVVRAIGDLKHRAGLAVVQPDRYRLIMDNRLARGRELGLDDDFVRAIMETIHEEAVRQQL